jgi:hypothetical protein
MPIPYQQLYGAALALLGALLLVGCKDADEQRAKDLPAAPATAKLDARDSVVGTPAAVPTEEAPATTPPVKTDMSKTQQSEAMPLPGQANDHSTLSPQASQKVKAVQRP